MRPLPPLLALLHLLPGEGSLEQHHQGPSPGSLDPRCVDMLGYDGAQLRGHGGAQQLGDFGHRHQPSLALPIVSSPGSYTQRSCFAPATAAEIVRLVERLQLMDPAQQLLDSVDGQPEDQVDVFQSQPLVDLVWPLVEASVVPSLAELYGLELSRMRVAEMFIRRCGYTCNPPL